MTDKEYLQKLDERLTIVEKQVHEREVSQLHQYMELEQLITKAVQDGNKDVLRKIEELEKRVSALEKKDGEKAKTIMKTILSTSLTWLIMGVLTNLPTILGLFDK